MTLIHDENASDFVQVNSGFMPRETEFGKLEGVPMFADNIELIPESEWIDRIKAMEEAKAFPRYLYEAKKPVHQYQDGHPLCWAYSLTQSVEMTDENYAQLAPESIVGVAGWRDTGFYCDRAIQWAMEHGIAERSFVPQYSLNPKAYKAGWEANAKRHRPVEWFDLGRSMWREVVTALLCGFAVYTGYNRFGHAITLDSLVVKDGKIGVSSPNTWREGTDRWTLFGSVAVPNEAFAVRKVAFD
jgi:hypothetical protein